PAARPAATSPTHGPDQKRERAVAEDKTFDEFLEAVASLRDSDPVRTTAHTSNAATETWLATTVQHDAAEPTTES
ncbi:hypothetical protein PV416_48825, partial [Streptomyces ipomoeae]|uniref:hypothetical protein n=1 Tax=Streptomyces ipomoeae TaxID=103232 RepID=UPI0029AA79E0